MQITLMLGIPDVVKPAMHNTVHCDSYRLLLQDCPCSIRSGISRASPAGLTATLYAPLEGGMRMRIIVLVVELIGGYGDSVGWDLYVDGSIGIGRRVWRAHLLELCIRLWRRDSR